MSSPRRSTKYVCRHCGEKRSPTLFPRGNDTECSDCLAKQAADAENTLEPAEPPPIAPQKRTPSLKILSTPPEEASQTAPPGLETASGGDVFTSPVPATDINKELAARTLARRSLLAFIKRFRPKYDAGWVHQDICRRLERFMAAVERQESPRMLLCMPVRMGKSEIGSRHFAPWVLGKHPDWEIIAASGGQSLAMSFSRYIRDLVRDPAYQSVFEHMKLDPTSQSVENWNTTYGGGYLAAGIGTMIVGRGAHVLLIDDPCTSPEAADSQLQRDGVWEWYIGAALNRLAPGGGVLGIMTHWNEDDWAGRVQALSRIEDADTFEIVKYPALNDQGDEYVLPDDSIAQFPEGTAPPEGSRLTRLMNTPLHPSRYTLKMLMNTKATYYALGNQRWWSALYQQNPAPEDGSFFTKDMFIEYVHAPQRHGRIVYQAWDFAITEKQKSDYTVAITALVDEYDNMYVLDVWRFKTDDGIELGTAIMQYSKTWGADLIAVEDGQIWKSIKSNFDKACEVAKHYPSYEVFVPLTDKRTRAQPARGRMQQKKIQFPARAPWYAEFKAELLRFQAGGRHDDQVDSLAMVVRLATTQAAPKGPPAPKLPTSWKTKLMQQLRGAGAGHMAA